MASGQTGTTTYYSNLRLANCIPQYPPYIVPGDTWPRKGIGKILKGERSRNSYSWKGHRHDDKQGRL